jgi:hypothetical protein
MQGVFISYRRQDSQSAAGRLADHLKEHMRGVPIFRDVETIEPGVDFVEAIGRALESCGVLLAVIGPRWANLADGAGRRRLDDPNDYTRLEIATALARQDVRVIPVLVEGAQMPGGDDLPENLKPLSRRNAIELTDKRWEYDVSQLVETLNKALDVHPEPGPPIPPTPPKPAPPEPLRPASGTWKKWAWGAGALVVLIAAYNAEEEAIEPVAPPPVAPANPRRPGPARRRGPGQPVRRLAGRGRRQLPPGPAGRPDRLPGPEPPWPGPGQGHAAGWPVGPGVRHRRLPLSGGPEPQPRRPDPRRPVSRPGHRRERTGLSATRPVTARPPAGAVRRGYPGPAR